MQITPGTQLGPYEIIGSIGAGGMGEVWRARDPRIGRDVAIKFVHAALRSPDRLHRFEQEARAAGSLSHPNLVTVFDLGTENSTPYVVMELLDGETLRQKLTDGARIAVRKAIEYAGQIAQGLAAAHEHGIVHRDLKPENIIVTQDGRVKIVDFGLAKLSARVEGQTDAATAQRDTAPGTVMGTAGYMSPEQVRGSSVDHRSDIFSFGAILYEMLSGRRAFKGDSSVETMNAVLKEDPPEFPTTDIPPAIDAIVRHCLEKNPGERFQSARDLAFDLQRLTSSSTSSSAQALRRPAAIPAWLLPAVIAAVIAAAAGFLAGRRSTPPMVTPPASTPPRSFTQLTFRSRELMPALSPDGKTFAFVSGQGDNADIFVQRVDGQNAINLTNAPGADTQPAFSPDGSHIAFRRGPGIFVMGATGESVRRVTDFGFNPAWSPDGKSLLVATSAGSSPHFRPSRSTLWLVDVATGTKRQITKRDAVQPAWSPTGKRAAFWGLAGDGGEREIFTVDPHAADPEKSVTRITTDKSIDWNPQWSPNGKWLYFGSDRDGTLNLWRIAIDESSGKASGGPEPMRLPSRFAGHFSISREGDIAFNSLEEVDTIWTIPLKGGAVSGEPQAILSGSMPIYSLSLSPDKKWIAFSIFGRREDIYLMRADGTDLRQLTNDAVRDRGPMFSSDGERVYFYSERSGRYEMWQVRTDGSDLKQLSRTTGPSLWFPYPSPDGKALYAFSGDTGAVRLPFNTDGTIDRMERLPSLPDGAPARWPRPSPDGRFVAVFSDQPATRGIWLFSVSGNSYERLTDAGLEPEWMPDGRSLIFRHPSEAPFGIVDVVTKKQREVTLPSSIVSGRYAIARDGSLLVATESKRSSTIWLMR